jgi:hypothetical protein
MIFFVIMCMFMFMFIFTGRTGRSRPGKVEIRQQGRAAQEGQWLGQNSLKRPSG